jgi:uncharacterized protein (DUF111 family)
MVVEPGGGAAGDAAGASSSASDVPPNVAGERRPDTLTLLETTVDDLSAEYLADAADTLRAAGARDAWLTPVLMKKGRPGVTLHVLAEPEDADRLARLLFVETSTFGVRAAQVQRLRLDERFDQVEVDGQSVGVRLGFLDGRLVTASPEFEDCRRAGERLRLPARLVYERAQAAARSRFGDG